MNTPLLLVIPTGARNRVSGLVLANLELGKSRAQLLAPALVGQELGQNARLAMRRRIFPPFLHFSFRLFQPLPDNLS